MLRPRSAPRAAGFTLIEMLVTMVVMAILMGLAMPIMSTWLRNSRLRAASDSLQDGIRLAQAEALRRSHQVVFSLTDDKPTDTTYTAKTNGKNWAAKTVKRVSTTEVSEFVEAGIVAELESSITITGPKSICFNSIGRLVANDDPGTNAGLCTLPTNTPPLQSYDISYADAVAGVDRPLRVTVALGGQVRLCDPAKSLSSDHPDGCP
ncbi:pilus assembly FimT family protein [Variovorax ginsengisoli]|uniref:Prepilin-type N-terminal cleavage/methylation domain-containing protein n=1 Tax=Variovorax ginsengisoli TaxID=363844 RepID=A0ABT8S3D0_9BURK|nr:prepilin-type N-terminal cleavage/methylation domain-containing protein [Variovorax ginsengisoli]MDN8614261.1 prepilin-type N-terminal cleavage/methylation domain-containing protein [Variovorax ginsengisoli]MDO1533431.1 prepilin-type N-terminal cleavage/methylation domain-containing protein [Variovorax ginsengisoli]